MCIIVSSSTVAMFAVETDKKLDVNCELCTALQWMYYLTTANYLRTYSKWCINEAYGHKS